MAITINGTGSITGLTAGGLPDGSVTNADLEYAGSSGQVLTSQGSSSAPQWTTLSTSNLTRSTYVASSGQTSIDFTDVPADARRITIVFNYFSFSGGTNLILRVGDSSTLYTSGYVSSTAIVLPSAYAVQQLTNGFSLYNDNQNFRMSGTMTLSNLTGNTWVYDCVNGIDDSGGTWVRGANFGGGVRTLSDTLTRFSITTTGGTATFDSGGVNVFYEV